MPRKIKVFFKPNKKANRAIGEKQRLAVLQRICKAHGTSIEKIPFWLLKKKPKRLEYWFEHGE
jgi:hypothetical protein